MVDLKTIEQLATDQSSLKAAAGLARPGKWSGLGASPDGVLIWGECAGSGANPYRVMSDLRDLGAKCTCPSRKFPCKHALGLLWMKAEATAPFPPAETPEWVADWLRRRRGTAASPRTSGETSGEAKDLRAARLEEPEAPPDPRAVARREAAAVRRAEDTERLLGEAIDAVEQWIGDQLRMGLAAFIDDATARCRRIAARLVDGKAAMLAGRLDELPSRLLALPVGDRPRAAAVELGKLVLLARAYRASPRDTEVRRAVANAETREAVLNDPATLRRTSRWETLAEQIHTRRDGLVAQTTWLLNLDPAGPRFAALIDYFPASAGRRGSVFVAGEQFTGELAYFPARNPLRALLVQRTALDEARELPWPTPEPDLASTLTEPQLHEPWALELPLLLPAGRIGRDLSGQDWWLGRDVEPALPMAGDVGRLLRGTELRCAAAIWSGARLEILAARTPWGRIGGHG